MEESSMAIAGSPRVENAFSAIPGRDSIFDCRLPQCTGRLRQTVVSRAPTVVGNGRSRRVTRHGVHFVGSAWSNHQYVVAVDRGLGGYAAHAEVVVLRRDEASHGGTVVREGVVDVGLVGVIVVIERGENVVSQVLMLEVHTSVHHRHVDAEAFVGGPHLLNAYVMPTTVAELVIVLQVPLASVERVFYACTPGNVVAAVF